MGSYASAYLVLGCLAPEGFDPETLPVLGPLLAIRDGSPDWGDDDCQTILHVKGWCATAFETAAIVPGRWAPEIKGDITHVVNAGKLFRHLTGAEWDPKWWLVPSYG